MKIRTYIYSFLGLFTLALVIIVSSYLWVSLNASSRLFSSVEDVPCTYETGLLLGTTSQTRIGHKTNRFFTYRIDATAALYQAGKIKYILISGDENSLDGVNEVVCMRDSLIARGVPDSVIILDGYGYRTLDSVVRCRHTYGCKSVIFISQQFHTERSIFLADYLNIDFEEIAGYNAKSPKSKMAMITYARETLARVKMLLDIVLKKSPKRIDSYEQRLEPITCQTGSQ